MTLYDLTKKYSTGKGEDMMWKTLSLVSDSVESSMSPCDRKKLIRKVYCAMSGGHYNEEFAHEDIESMFFTDKNGKQHQAPYWSTQAIEEVYEGVKDEILDYNLWDFAVTMNMLASDNWCLLERWFPGITEKERNVKLVEMSVNWLLDEDAKHPDSKIWHYLNG